MLNNFGENGKNVEVYVLKIINNQLDFGSLEEKQDLKDLLDPELSGYCNMLCNSLIVDFSKMSLT